MPSSLVQEQRLASQAEARGRAAGTALAEWPNSRARGELCAQPGAPGSFNWRAGLPLKPRQPILSGARARPANGSARLPPSPPGALGSPGGCGGASAALTSVRLRPLPALAAHICPSSRRQESVPTPFSFKGQRAEGGEGRWAPAIHSGQKGE